MRDDAHDLLCLNVSRRVGLEIEKSIYTYRKQKRFENEVPGREPGVRIAAFVCLLKRFRVFLRLMRSLAGNAAATMLGIDQTPLIGAKVSTRSRYITSA
jgi:hypothetical protein